MRRVIGEALMSMAALVILLATLVALDPRLRDHVTGVLRKDTLAADVARSNAEAHGAMTAMKVSAREYGLDQAALVVFAAVATGLVVAMLRL